MSKCDECGAQMRWFREGYVMCSRLYDLALKRSLANDHRTVDHASLEDVPLVQEAQPSAGPRA